MLDEDYTAEDERAQLRGEQDEYLKPDRYFARNRKLAAKAIYKMRNQWRLTFDSALRGNFHVVQTVWGTNIHPRAVIETKDTKHPSIEYTAFRIADFVVASLNWKEYNLGVFQRHVKGVVDFDDELVTTTVAWRDLSDHFPVGGRFSTAFDLRVKQVLSHVINEDLDERKRQAKLILKLMTSYSSIPLKQRDKSEAILFKCWKGERYDIAFEAMRDALVSFFEDAGLSFDKESGPVFELFASLDISCRFDDLSNCLQKLAELHTARLNPVPVQESLLLMFQ